MSKITFLKIRMNLLVKMIPVKGQEIENGKDLLGWNQVNYGVLKTYLNNISWPDLACLNLTLPSLT